MKTVCRNIPSIVLTIVTLLFWAGLCLYSKLKGGCAWKWMWLQLMWILPLAFAGSYLYLPRLVVTIRNHGPASSLKVFCCGKEIDLENLEAGSLTQVSFQLYARGRGKVYISCKELKPPHDDVRDMDTLDQRVEHVEFVISKQ